VDRERMRVFIDAMALPPAHSDPEVLRRMKERHELLVSVVATRARTALVLRYLEEELAGSGHSTALPRLPWGLDPLSLLRWFVPRQDRNAVELVREDLYEDLRGMCQHGVRSRWVALAVIWWRSLTEFAPFFWRGVRRLLPFKKVGWEKPGGN
jgi:hypothetical protein